jgi:serine/threonine-protein kinase
MLKVKELLLSMEMFEGETLEKSKSLSLGDVLLVFRMIADGLNAMHQQGYIHCDIKPNNILINESGAIRIIDLGQGCKIGTIKPRIQGTPDYIAPEQVKRKHLDQRTDVFNLGATMYWALTGKNVLTLIPQSNDISATLGQRNFPAPHQLHRRIPLGVSKLVTDCVKEEPGKRPSSMAEVISRLDLLIHSIFAKKLRNQ